MMIHWKQLAKLTDDVLAIYDIAAVNLACTTDLPDAPGPLTIMECLHKLDEWAKLVRRYTELAYEEFYLANPAKYDHSEALFRSLSLVTALQRHCGLRYNPAKIPDHVPLETADIFIHGALLGEGGTCTSIPVVLAAVGRRLGYPIKIVETRTAKWGHLFARWDDPKGERLNLEATGTGLGTHDDNYYRTGRYALAPALEKACQFLKSMTPRQELACFLEERGYQLRQQGCVRLALEAFAWSANLAPNRCHQHMLGAFGNEWWAEQEKQKTLGFPVIFIAS